MARGQSIERFCGRTGKRGTPCKRPAGWGTTHKGRGPCRFHGGVLPNVIQRYAREEAIEHARRFLDEDVDISPFDAALLNVRVACGMVRYMQAKIRNLEHPSPDDERALSDAIAMSQRVIDIALKAGIAERLVNIAERAGDAITAAAEEGLAAAKLSDEQRTAFADAFEMALAKLEAPEPKQLSP